MSERRDIARWRRGWQAAVVASIAIGAGCIATPVPEPPNLEPPEIESFQVEVSRQVGTILIAGAPGAVEPETVVWGVDLDTADPPATTTAVADGSFALTLTAAEGDELRLQYRCEAVRSDPVDALVTGAGGLERSVVAADLACVELAPALELDLGAAELGGEAAGSIEVRNDCGEAIRVSAARLRVETGPFELVTAPPLDVAAGGVADVEVRFGPTAAGLAEEVLLLEAGAAAVDRRAVTLFGQGVAP